MKNLDELKPSTTKEFVDLWELAHGESRITFTDARRLLSEPETETGADATETMLKACVREGFIVRHHVSRGCSYRICMFERVSDQCTKGAKAAPRRGRRPKRKRKKPILANDF